MGDSCVGSVWGDEILIGTDWLKMYRYTKIN